MGGGGGGLAQPLNISAQNASDSGIERRFPRLFISWPKVADRRVSATRKHHRAAADPVTENEYHAFFIAQLPENDS